MPETLHYIYDPNWFPQSFVNIPEIPSETIQKLSINHHNIEIGNYNAETQPFTCTNIPENTNTSLKVSPIENMDTLIHSKQSENRMNETTETDFSTTLLVDGTLFSSHTVNTSIDLEDNDRKITQITVITPIIILLQTQPTASIFTEITNRQPLNSIELTQNSDPLNTTIPILPNVNTPLPRLHRKNSVHFNTEPINFHNSTQPTHGTNENIQITPQQLVNFDKQLISQNT